MSGPWKICDVRRVERDRLCCQLWLLALGKTALGGVVACNRRPSWSASGDDVCVNGGRA